jgi:preprotein translocase SecE subunit
MDNAKYIVIAFLCAAILVGFSVRGLAVPLLASLEMADPQLFAELTATGAAGLITGIATFLILNRHSLVYTFTDEAVSELRRVTWPGKEETWRSTLVVIICTGVLMATLAAYDFVWKGITKAFLFTAG